MCADNGIVEEGISQTGKEVTAVVTANFARGGCACLMAQQAGADVFPVDIGVEMDLGPLGECFPLLDRKIRGEDQEFPEEPALTRREVLLALKTGIELTEELKKEATG